MSAPNIIEVGYIEDWRKILIDWLGWTDERLDRFVHAFNAKLAREDGEAAFYNDTPINHIVPLLVRNDFDERLGSNMRRPEYGAPEWTYFHREMQMAIEGGEYYTGRFDWDAARARAVSHLEKYGEKFPLPEEVTNYEKRILAFAAR